MAGYLVSDAVLDVSLTCLTVPEMSANESTWNPTNPTLLYVGDNYYNLCIIFNAVDHIVSTGGLAAFSCGRCQPVVYGLRCHYLPYLNKYSGVFMGSNLNDVGW